MKVKELKNQKGSFVVVKNGKVLACRGTGNLQGIYSFEFGYGVYGELDSYTTCVSQIDSRKHSDDDIDKKITYLLEFGGELVPREQVRGLDLMYRW